MRIKIWASTSPELPDVGPFKSIDIVERKAPYQVGDATHYGPVVLLPALTDNECDQSVVVRLDPANLNATPGESILERPPASYAKIQLSPISMNALWTPEETLPSTPYPILEAENLAIENLSPMLKPGTFSVWSQNCELSRDTTDALQNMDYAIVRHYTSSTTERDSELDQRSARLVISADECLRLIRPTRRSRAARVHGFVKPDGTLYPQGFNVIEPAEVPEVQKLFTVRTRDVEALRVILPEFLELYRTDAEGKQLDEYEPLRMAVQLYGEAYALHYWKARLILWWSAIESLYGSAEDAATARIFAFFGDKSLSNGYGHSIYEPGDIPSCYTSWSDRDHTLGETVPLIYSVRNHSAHGQRVPDQYFGAIKHPFGSVVGLEVIAEAATFIIRKTITEILRRGLRARFKDRGTRDDFWLYEYGLDRTQSKKRLKEMHALRNSSPHRRRRK